jgi:hypothetical protein
MLRGKPKSLLFFTKRSLSAISLVEGKEGVNISNPTYDEWYVSDQQVFGFLLSSLSKEVLPQVATRVTTTAASSEIENMFLSVAEYINKMKMLGEEMTAAGRPLEDEELIEYFLTSLNQDYHPIVSIVIARCELVSLSELYSQLLAFENRHALMSAQEGGDSFANAASRGGGRNNRGSFGHGGGSDSSAGDGRGCFNSTNGRRGGSIPPVTSAPPTKFARTRDTPHIGVGIALIKNMSHKKGLLLLLLPMLKAMTSICILIRVLQIISPQMLRS